MPASPKSFGFELRGDKKMINQLAAIAQVHPGKVEKALVKIAWRVIRRSQREFVPKDTQKLSRSAYVTDPDSNKAGSKIQLGFSAPHARAVHEHLSASSPYSWRVAEREGRPVNFQPGKGPKYLETPLHEAAKTMAADLAKELHL